VSDKQLSILGGADFETLKQTNQFGAEFWSARDLQPHLGYDEWRKFEGAIRRAMVSCTESGNDRAHHFVGAAKMVRLGSKAQRSTKDYQLSRFACYLIAQNGDPRKPEIARAQKYFAVQTRRQELSDRLAADRERLDLRKQTAEDFKALSGAARQAGVQNRMFGVFHDAGYKGLYGGLGRNDIKVKKSIPAKENLVDRMNATELAANQFRMTQTRDKLSRDGIRNEHRAIRAHEQVGREVRQAIQRIGGELPENIPPAEHIRKVQKRVRLALPKPELGSDAAGSLTTEIEGAKER
jgi:DNA-damage-inducible protein D